MGPGLLDFQDFLGCGWSGGGGQKSGGDDLVAECGEHVQGGGFGLGPVPRRGGPAMCGVGGGVAVAGVPDDEQAVAEQPERHGAFDGCGDAVAACSTPRMFLTSKKVTSMLQRAA